VLRVARPAMGSSGHGVRLVGSVTEELVKKSPAPVVVAQAEYSDPTKVSLEDVRKYEQQLADKAAPAAVMDESSGMSK
jgi:hypothetical protein